MDSFRRCSREEVKQKGFDVDLICRAFDGCLEDKNLLAMDSYLEAYKEILRYYSNCKSMSLISLESLFRFFNMLGAVFSFVAKDVQSKLDILEEYRNKEDIGKHYESIQSMIEYEKAMHLLKDNKRSSGARTLLRLHRALEFFSLFMSELSKTDDQIGTGPVAKDCYKKTLAKYHPWYIRNSATIALTFLPNREQLSHQAFPPDYCTTDTVTTSMLRLAEKSNLIYNATQKLYEEYDLLDLP